MIGIVAISHGTLASGLVSAVSLLMGKQQGLATAELHPGDDPAGFKALVEGAIDSVDEGEGVLVLADIFGGTPSNSVSQLLGRPGVQSVAGVNLPMLVQALLMRDQCAIEELPAQALQAGQEALIDIRQRLVEVSQGADDEEDF